MTVNGTSIRGLLAFLLVLFGSTNGLGSRAEPSTLAADRPRIAGPPAADEPQFTVVILPDTQYYAAQYPLILEAQARWIVKKRDENAIALVIHEGDIVDRDEPAQWARASASLHLLDGVVPYVLSIGNHDYDRVGRLIERHSSVDAYFPPDGFAGTDWFKGTFEPGRIENSYAVVETPSGPWLVLSLEFGPRDSVLEWADRVAQRFPTVPAMVVTHAYLTSDGRRYDRWSPRPQPWHPRLYLGDTVAGGANDGEEIWRKLIAKNDNIRFVFCGHDLGDGLARLTSVRRDGSKVHQILANYQMEALGGSGYLRLMRFFPARPRVAVSTYSPYLDAFKDDPDNRFELDY